MEDKTVVTTAPPPPSEVKIRTMRSDLASMRASGGGMPKFQNVAVKGLSLDKGYSSAIHPTLETHDRAPVAPVYSAPAVAAPGVTTAPAALAPASTPESAGPANNFVPILIVTIVAILAIAGVGYFAYITFFK